MKMSIGKAAKEWTVLECPVSGLFVMCDNVSGFS